MPPETFDEFWSDLEGLVESSPEVKPLKGFTKSHLNGITPAGLDVAGKPGGKGSLVPRTLFMVLWNALNHNESLSRESLEEDHNLTRVTLLMSIVNKLDYMEYEDSTDSIRLVK